ncbi:RhoGAP-domain-containing protein [Trematosphaeria pertusa]|uniref:RhoGAP-domain-containing protein n=1 Tax=Trematosphaeria pertusa TaxID=390896 RepID=A0A6A6I3L0_9PLEO|nr:RhoGAP-domain-containing protein [Trematosphaeria pertusa]KAF2245074.1 RhoGAP-domain-containing protein [Trematosphaeria pertusa]
MAAPTLPPMETDSFNPDFNNVSGAANGTAHADGAAASPVDAAASAPAVQLPDQKHDAPDAPDAQTQHKVHDVLHSDIGVNTLLNRLKASIASARDFASFLKRRGAMEEEHANSLKKLSRLTLDNIRKPEARHESYQTQFEHVMHANERIADNGTQFGLALHAMHENLLQLANKMDGSRKTWKQQGLTAEQKVQDAERLAEKAKAKYDQLAEDLDRVKTGDTGAGRKFGLKGPKSAAQHEEDLQRKVQAADQDYASKVQTAQSYRKELVATTRPQAVAALVDLIKEIDAALTMEMQKYASFNEKLVVNNGQVVSPQPLKGGATQPSPTINQLIYQINNERDFDDYVLKHASKVPSVRSDLQYVKHPTQAPTHAQPTPPAATVTGRRTSMQMQSQPAPAFGLQQSDTAQSPAHYQAPSQPEPVQQPSYQSYNTGYSQQQQQQQQQQQVPQQYQSPYGASAYSPVAQNPYSQPDYPRGPAGQAAAQQTSGVLYGGSSPPVNPVFGVNLDQLFARDGSPVPLVVYQCIQAVDLYGLEVEGIYRIPGTASHIQAMKALFDSAATQVDFRNPEAFQHDVNSVAGLLKQFFRELPDPLLTKDFYTKFIDAARIDDDTMRRDSMHALINALPDPNYATLRALMLHLHRVEQSSEVNRMSTANLGICWAPSIMGPHKGSNMADAGLQARVIITILDNVLQIFDED